MSLRPRTGAVGGDVVHAVPETVDLVVSRAAPRGGGVGAVLVGHGLDEDPVATHMVGTSLHRADHRAGLPLVGPGGAFVVLRSLRRQADPYLGHAAAAVAEGADGAAADGHIALVVGLDVTAQLLHNPNLDPVVTHVELDGELVVPWQAADSGQPVPERDGDFPVWGCPAFADGLVVGVDGV